MSTNYIVIVVGVNGKRTNVKVNLDTSILQIIEEACTKQKLEPELYDIKHLKRILDHSSTIRYSNIPNKALLELVEARTPRKESLITVNLATDTGEFLVEDFDSSKSLWDILEYHVNKNNLSVPSTDSGLESVVAYTLRRIIGESLKSTTLKSLGLLSGKCMLRYNTQKYFPSGPVQANVSGPLLKQKYVKKEECSDTSILSTRNSEFSEILQEVVAVENGDNNHLECTITNQLSEDEPENPNKILEPSSSEFMKFQDSLSAPSFESVPLVDAEATEQKSKTSNDIQKESPTYLEPDKVVGSSTVIKLGNHDAILFNFDDAPPTLMSDESDAFYELSVNEVKKLYDEHVKQLQLYETMPMMTRQMRDMDRDARLLSAMNRHPVTQLRICFPDRNVIQANFKPRSTITEVMDFIKPFLANPDLPFHLYTVFPKQILNPEISLVEANCIPKARLYFGCEHICSNFLSEETLQNKSSFEGATKEIVKPKNFSGNGFKLSASSSHLTSSSTSHDAPQRSNLVRSSQNLDKKPKWFKLGK